MKFTSLVLFSCSHLSTTASMVLATPKNTNNAGGAGVHVPVGKDGEGLYTASTKGCFDVIPRKLEKTGGKRRETQIITSCIQTERQPSKGTRSSILCRRTQKKPSTLTHLISRATCGWERPRSSLERTRIVRIAI